MTYCAIDGKFTFWNVPGAVVFPLRLHCKYARMASESNALKIEARLPRVGKYRIWLNVGAGAAKAVIRVPGRAHGVAVSRLFRNS
jgi:hypothetical protein